jgi:hypothetical protein
MKQIQNAIYAFVLLLAYSFFAPSALFAQQSSEQNSPNELALAFVLGEEVTQLQLEQNFNGLKAESAASFEAAITSALTFDKQREFTRWIWSKINAHLDAKCNVVVTEQEQASYSERFNAWDKISERLKMRKQSQQQQQMLKAVITQQMQDTSRRAVERYKRNKCLYEEYGGTVIFQQSNPLEPVGAMRQYLLTLQEIGQLNIFDPQLKESFWRYYLQEQAFEIPPDKVDFSLPWWLAQPVPESEL